MKYKVVLKGWLNPVEDKKEGSNLPDFRPKLTVVEDFSFKKGAEYSCALWKESGNFTISEIERDESFGGASMGDKLQGVDL